MNAKKVHYRRRLTRGAIVFAAILLAAIVLRVVWLSQLAGSEIGSEPSIDSRFYRSLASDILAGKGLPPGALTFNPLYPFFLVVVFRLFGESLLATRLIQALVGLATILLVYLGGRRLVDGSKKEGLSTGIVSLVAMAMAVLYTQLLLYEGMLLGVTIEVFLLTASFTLALAMDQETHGGSPVHVGSRRLRPWLAGGILGVLCGLGALGRPNLFLPLVAALPVWLIARNPRKRTWLAPVAGFAVGAALALVPPTLYNANNSGEFIPVSAHGGINLYIGNRSGTVGVYQPPADMRGEMRGLIEDARAKAERETGRSMTDAEVSDFYTAKALADIKSDPARWLVLLGRKLILFWNKVEVHDMPEVEYFQDWSRLFRAPFLSFALIAPLGLVGLIVLLRGERNRSVVCVFLGTALVSVLLFYVNSRYRLPIVPVVVLLAALAIAWAKREISQQRLGPVALMAVLAVAVFFLVSDRTIVKANRGSVYTFLGTFYMNKGDTARGAQAFAEAYRLDPTLDVSMINHGRTLLMQEQFAQAAEVLGKAYTRNPRYPLLVIEYAYALQGAGRQEEAHRLYLEAFSSGRPDEQVIACKVLAQEAYLAGEKNAALRWVTAGIKIAPDDAELPAMLQAVEAMKQGVPPTPPPE